MIVSGPIAYLDAPTFDGRCLRRLDTPVGPDQTVVPVLVLDSTLYPNYEVGRLLTTWRAPIRGAVVISGRLEVRGVVWDELAARGPVRACIDVLDLETDARVGLPVVLAGRLAGITLAAGGAPVWPLDTILTPEGDPDAST